MKTKFFTLCLVIAFYFTLQSQEQGSGLLFDENKYNEITLSVPLVSRSLTSLPSSHSLKPYCPTPKSQGQQGSCTAWASAYGARTIASAIKNGWKNDIQKINANAFSPAFVYNVIKNKSDNTCSRGSFISDAMLLMQKYGVPKMSNFPYNPRSCSRKPTNGDVALAQPYKIKSFERLIKYPNSYNVIPKVKKAISQNNPVVIGMHDYGTLAGVGELWQRPTYTKKGGGHAMVVVGYDNNKYGGAFEIMNSWGADFRNKGFFWLKYADFKTFVKTAVVLIDPPSQNNNNVVINNDNKNYYTYNKLGGNIQLRLANGTNMPVSLASGASRGFNIVKVSKATYKVNKAYSSGTQFRIYLNSKQRGYVYLIGYGGADKSVAKLYPFENYSAFFNYTNSEIAIPNEDYFIEFDNKPGQDILCVLYSKEPLNISDIVSKAQYGSGDFVTRVKNALQNKMFKGSSVKFNQNAISFSANSSSQSAKVVPIFIAMNHQ